MSDAYEQAKKNFQQATSLENYRDLFKDPSTNQLHYGVLFPDDYLVGLYSGLASDFHELGRYTALHLQGVGQGQIMIDFDTLEAVMQYGNLTGHTRWGETFSSYYDGRDTVHLQRQGDRPEYLIADWDDLAWLYSKLKPIANYYPDPALLRYPELAQADLVDLVGGRHNHNSQMKPSRDRHEEGDPRFPGGCLVMDQWPISDRRFHYLHYEEYGMQEFGRFAGIYLNAWRDRHLVETVFVYPDTLLRGRTVDIEAHLRWPERVVYGVQHRPNGIFVYNARWDEEWGLYEKHHVHMSRAKFEWLCRCLEPLKEGNPTKYYKKTA